MNDRILSIEEFNRLIQQWSGENIKITKHELRDEDAVFMKLNNISYDTDTRRIDDYVPMHSVHLHGEGRTATDAQNSQPLPATYYEIPLEDSTEYKFDNQQFTLTTERGTYTIEIINQ